MRDAHSLCAVEGARCSRCGRSRTADDQLTALAWVSERDERGNARWLCPDCARTHVRDIEGKLDQEWW